MIAITVKYLPATNTKGARVKASTGGKRGGLRRSVTIGYHSEVDPFQAAAIALIKKLDWQDKGDWFCGHLDCSNDVHVFVCSPKYANARLNII